MTEREQQWAAYRAWNKDFKGPIYFFNWDQWIKEYGFAVWQASRRAALAEAAKACHVKSDEYHAAYKRSPVDDPRRGNAYVEGMSDGCSNCADAIRALPQKE